LFANLQADLLCVGLVSRLLDLDRMRAGRNRGDDKPAGAVGRDGPPFTGVDLHDRHLHTGNRNPPRSEGDATAGGRGGVRWRGWRGRRRGWGPDAFERGGAPRAIEGAPAASTSGRRVAPRSGARERERVRAVSRRGARMGGAASVGGGAPTHLKDVGPRAQSKERLRPARAAGG